MKIDLPKIFEGETVTIVGGGESLIGFNFDKIKSPSIAVNRSILVHRNATMWLFTDYSGYVRINPQIKSFKGFKITIKGRIKSLPHLHYIELDYILPIDSAIRKANLSGFTALAIAFYLGAEKVYLFGYDGGYKDQSNFDMDNKNIISKNYEQKNYLYDIFKGYNVINVGMNSKINAFPKIELKGFKYQS